MKRSYPDTARASHPRRHLSRRELFSLPTSASSKASDTAGAFQPRPDFSTWPEGHACEDIERLLIFTALQKVRAVVQEAQQPTESTDGEEAVPLSTETLSSCIHTFKKAYVHHLHEAFESGSAESAFDNVQELVYMVSDKLTTHFQANAIQLGRHALGQMLQHSIEQLEWQTCQEIFEGCASLARKQKEEANERASNTEKQIKRAKKVDF